MWAPWEGVPCCLHGLTTPRLLASICLPFLQKLLDFLLGKSFFQTPDEAGPHLGCRHVSPFSCPGWRWGAGVNVTSISRKGFLKFLGKKKTCYFSNLSRLGGYSLSCWGPTFLYDKSRGEQETRELGLRPWFPPCPGAHNCTGWCTSQQMTVLFSTATGLEEHRVSLHRPR